MDYWICSVTPDNFRIAFEKKIWAFDSVSRRDLISIGDRILFYVKGTNEFRGSAEVTGQWMKAAGPIWKGELEENQVIWPWQAPIRWLALGRVNAKNWADKLSFIKNKADWHVYLMGSPANFRHNIPERDYNLVVSKMEAMSALTTQVELPTEKIKSGGANVIFEPSKMDITHTEIQYMLIKLGKYGRCDVWVPSADRGRSFNDELFENLTLQYLPQLGFEDKVRRIVENIDVLWFRQNTIIAAFEVEHTTSIYSGLLRMADLISVQPNVRFSLFIVIPDERRDKAKEEITRPTFEINFRPPLSQICRVSTYDDLIKVYEEVSKASFPPTWDHDNVNRLGDIVRT
ncbi:MAG: EVE domain-containing protein [Nitrososphaerota archaeon]|nr:EVE domain-containing protein [Nitrososphaerota archaeon]